MTEKEDNNNSAPSIKSFIYLDTDKMYSISSQLFSGLTEYILSSSEQSFKQTDQQNGGFFDGRKMGDILEQTKNHSERKFLHDYAYTLFENKLTSDQKVIDINHLNITESISRLKDYRFIRVTGRVIFNDTMTVEETIRKFNEIGYAIGYVTIPSEIREGTASLNQSINEIKDRNKKAASKAMVSSKLDFIKIFKERGLMLDPEYIKHLSWILNYGYTGIFEVQMPINSSNGIQLFSGHLKRNMLREEANTLRHKYSRETEKEFSMFGILTQIDSNRSRLHIFEKKEETNDENNQIDENENDMKLKKAFAGIVSSLINIENQFVMKLDNEYVIDPIAVYLEL